MTQGSQRLDKWLWYARFFKSRSLATRFCAAGRLRVNGVPVAKAHFAVKPGDVLTFAKERRVHVVRVRALGARRGPAAEARTLYEDLGPAPGRAAAAAPRLGPSDQGRAPRHGSAAIKIAMNIADR